MDCLGLAAEWEKCVDVRTRLREEKRLLVHQEKEKFCEPNRINAVQNAMVLRPVLLRLSCSECYRLPHLEDLTLQVTTLFEKCGLSTGDKGAYKASVEIKKLAGFIKRRAQRKEVTKDMGLIK